MKIPSCLIALALTLSPATPRAHEAPELRRLATQILEVTGGRVHVLADGPVDPVLELDPESTEQMVATVRAVRATPGLADLDARQVGWVIYRYIQNEMIPRSTRAPGSPAETRARTQFVFCALRRANVYSAEISDEICAAGN